MILFNNVYSYTQSPGIYSDPAFSHTYTSTVVYTSNFSVMHWHQELVDLLEQDAFTTALYCYRLRTQIMGTQMERPETELRGEKELIVYYLSRGERQV